MKNLLLAVVLIFGGMAVSAQGKLSAEKWKEFEAQKIAFFTQELDLSPEEAALFWPLYNEMQKKIKEIGGEMRREFKAMKARTDLKEEDYRRAIENELNRQAKIGKLKEDYYKKMLAAIPASKIWRLDDAERKFHRQLFDKLRKEHPAKK